MLSFQILILSRWVLYRYLQRIDRETTRPTAPPKLPSDGRTANHVAWRDYRNRGYVPMIEEDYMELCEIHEKDGHRNWKRIEKQYVKKNLQIIFLMPATTCDAGNNTQ